MSAIAEERARLVEALAKVPELAALPTQPGAIMAGHAWPAWSSTSWRTACVTTRQWYVFVAVPAGDEPTIVDGADQLVDDIATVLWTVGKVTQVEPWRLPVDQAQQAAVPALRFTMEV